MKAELEGGGQSRPIGGMVSRVPLYVRDSMWADRVWRLLVERNLPTAPVLDDHGRPVGLVARGTVCPFQALAQVGGHRNRSELVRKGLRHQLPLDAVPHTLQHVPRPHGATLDAA